MSVFNLAQKRSFPPLCASSKCSKVMFTFYFVVVVVVVVVVRIDVSQIRAF
jgi:hypothetical protein